MISLFSLYTPPLTARHLKKVLSGIRKNSVRHFASGIHQNYGYKRFTQGIKSSLIDVYDRFHLQCFKCLNHVYDRFHLQCFKCLNH